VDIFKGKGKIQPNAILDQNNAILYLKQSSKFWS